MADSNQSLIDCIRDLRAAVEGIQAAVGSLHTKLDSQQQQRDLSESADSALLDAAVIKHWYAVTVGRNPGVFCGPESVQSNIYRIPGGYAKRCDTHEEAVAVFETALDAGLVERTTYEVVTLSRADRPRSTYN
ncbi:hypothetical protein D9613_012565 [Agrocybe pediades]|uniref:Ribonuclease H1 N-terminal domain-containing protein n=1 Tax=Agrocybe pediades TaxID=84607 RepID=A0A8H4QXV0_9AGAR|nr:hypothetical protein D9613_012354 [Agrocybe pediades]KAF4612540.1 hypothetical protein D9613_012778 [Agrocybe pediades]KAF4618798.1 hypothetical protein D9613_009712 [Agrocybe pediades]KAF4621637.1 hypothetical protein D9613_012565 [Agrocybe pediades]